MTHSPDTNSPILIDTRGQKCPMPVLKLEKALSTAPIGQHLILLATDPIAKLDIALYCQQHGHSCKMEQKNAPSPDSASHNGQTLLHFTIVAGQS